LLPQRADLLRRAVQATDHQSPSRPAGAGRLLLSRPLREPQQLRARARRRPDGLRAGGAFMSQHILVVDDSAVVRQAFTMLIGKEFTVDTAADPIIAAQKMKKRRPAVVVLDLQ